MIQPHLPKCISLILFQMLFNVLPAQVSFAWPNASTYNKYNDKYYITNYKGGNVISLDANGNKAIVASGLTAPNNLLYAALPIGEGYIVLDSNEIKGYDSGWNYYASFTTLGAKKMQDAVFDDVNNILYITDVDRGVIYKTVFGGAPFYLPSTSVFCAPFRRPSAMVWQKSKNRILYVEDTTGGNLMAVNLTNGTTSLVKTLNMDNLVGLAEDAQGNLYLSSQGLKGIYQLNKYYAGNPVKLYSEPKPGDLLVNPIKDQWVYMCLICGTVFTPPLHLFGPGLEIAGCPKDSFHCYKNYLHRNIGTFDPGNQFIMEMSNKAGQFVAPKQLVKINDTLIPATMDGLIPTGMTSGTGYKVRWRSTKPAVIGSMETMEIFPLPSGSAASSDTIFACAGSAVTLGNSNPRDTSNHYAWQPAQLLDSAFAPTVKYQAKQKQKIWLTMKNNFGCISKDSVFIDTISSPNPGKWKDTLYGCKDNGVILGASQKGGMTYLWSPGHLLSDSTAAQPVYQKDNPQKFMLHLEGNGGCAANFSQMAVVYPNPDFSLLSDSISICDGDSFENKTNYKPAHQSLWTYQFGDSTYSDKKVIYSDQFGHYFIKVTDSATQCSTSKKFILDIFAPVMPSLTALNDSFIKINYPLKNTEWFRNDTLLKDTGQIIKVRATGNYKACGENKNGCWECTATKYFMVNSNQNMIYFLNKKILSVYPIPVQNLLQWQIALPTPDLNWKIQDLQGRTIKYGNGFVADVTEINPGIYLFHSNNVITKFIKE